jgi:hypothetical protein
MLLISTLIKSQASLLGLLVSLAAPALDGAAEAPVLRAGVPPGQYYELIAIHSLKCVDVANASVAHAAPVVQATCWGGGNQKWKFRDVGGGYYEIVVQHSSKCLDVAYASLDHAAPVVQGDCWGGTNQHWRLNEVGSANGEAYYQILAQHSGKCLDVAFASLKHAAPIIQGNCWGGANQHFILRPIAP